MAAISSTNSSSIWNVVSDTEWMQTGLLATSVVFSTMSVIPQYRPIGALGLRGTNILSSAVSSATNWSKNEVFKAAIDLGQIATTSLNVAGIYSGSNSLISHSLLADCSLRTLRTFQAIYQQDWENGLKQAGLIAVDALTIAAVNKGSHGYLFGAVALNLFYSMLINMQLAAIADEKSLSRKVINSVSFGALAIVNGISAYAIPELRNGPRKGRTVYREGIPHDKFYLMPVGGPAGVDPSNVSTKLPSSKELIEYFKAFLGHVSST